MQPGGPTMKGSTTFRLGMFTKHVGDTFGLCLDEEDRDIQLIEAVSRVSNGIKEDDSEATQFSITFLDPEATVQRYLPQATYRIQHNTLGQLDLFLVPTGPGKDGKGIRYESVFNNILSS